MTTISGSRAYDKALETRREVIFYNFRAIRRQMSGLSAYERQQRLMQLRMGPWAPLVNILQLLDGGRRG
jgi:hypothetical protein